MYAKQPCSNFKVITAIVSGVPIHVFTIFTVNTIFLSQCVVLFAIPWSIGAVVDVDGRHKFDAFYKELVGGNTADAPVPKAVGKLEVPLPNDNVYDIYFEVGILDSVQEKFMIEFKNYTVIVMLSESFLA